LKDEETTGSPYKELNNNRAITIQKWQYLCTWTQDSKIT